MTDITIPEGSAFARFGGTVWPIPGEQLRELEHTLRYAQRGYIFNMQERLLVASVLNAYIELVRQTQKRRNEIAANLFAAVQMTDITPPPELVQQWRNEEPYEGLLSRAAQYGADQELEACCKVLEVSDRNAREFLYAARRPKPKPLSLKEQALEMLENAWEGGHVNNNAAQTIRRALEALDD